MTTDELEQLLAQQPVGRLHRLARGRVHRHFRLGKQRLIEALLRHAPEQRAGLESDLSLLIREDSTVKARTTLPSPPIEAAGPPPLLLLMNGGPSTRAHVWNRPRTSPLS